jgi:photosystem II stability/assembly factor-like uncharacterized protein
VPEFANCDGNMYLSADAGNTWKAMSDNTVLNAFLSHFHSTTEGFAIVPTFEYQQGPDEETSNLNGFEVYQTTNGGLTWDKSIIDKACDFTGTTFIYSNDIFYTLGWDAVNKFKRK